MSELPKKLDKETRNEAKNRCGYCLGEQKYILAWLEIEHIFPRAKGGNQSKKIYGWRVPTAIRSKVLKLTVLIRKPEEKS